MKQFLQQRIQMFKKLGLLLSDCLEPVEFKEHYLHELLPGVKEYVLERRLPEQTDIIRVLEGAHHSLLLYGCRGIGKTAFLRMLSPPALFTSFQGNVPFEALRSAEITEHAMVTAASHMLLPPGLLSNHYLRHERQIVQQKNIKLQNTIFGQLNKASPRFRVNTAEIKLPHTIRLTHRFRALAVDDFEFCDEERMRRLCRSLSSIETRPLVISSAVKVNLQKELMVQHNDNETSKNSSMTCISPSNPEPEQKPRFYHVKETANQFDYTSGRILPAMDKYVRNLQGNDQLEQVPCFPADESLQIEVCIDFCSQAALEVRELEMAYLVAVHAALGVSILGVEFVKSNYPGVLDLRANLMRLHFWQKDITKSIPYQIWNADVSLLDRLSALETGFLPLDAERLCNLYERSYVCEFMRQYRKGKICSLQEYYFRQEIEWVFETEIVDL